MADTNLKSALRRAGITPEEFAEIVRVDPKTVQRWGCRGQRPVSPAPFDDRSRARSHRTGSLPERTPPPAADLTRATGTLLREAR